MSSEVDFGSGPRLAGVIEAAHLRLFSFWQSGSTIQLEPMIKERYVREITRIVDRTVSGKTVRAFIFGSSVKRERYGDCDLGILGRVSEREVRALKTAFEDSTLPFHVDVVPFAHVAPGFKKNVLNGPILWIKPSDSKKMSSPKPSRV